LLDQFSTGAPSRFDRSEPFDESSRSSAVSGTGSRIWSNPLVHSVSKDLLNGNDPDEYLKIVFSWDRQETKQAFSATLRRDRLAIHRFLTGVQSND
jgi:hypothetical protein